MASAAYENARTNRSATYAAGVKMIFPAYDAFPGQTLCFGTREFECDGDLYLRALADVPFTRFQRGGGQDTSDFQINDPDQNWYWAMKDYEDVAEDIRVIIKDCLLTENEIFESETVMDGFVERHSLADSSLQIAFNIVSDMSRTGFLTAGRILTQRYCAAIFNKNGLKAPEYDPCGWQTAQGGNAVFCTHKREGTDGCIDHNNEWRYYAVEALTSAQIQTYTGGSGGWTYGGSGSCFSGDTLVWMADGSYKKIKDVVAGDYIWSHTVAGTLKKCLVLQQHRHVVEQLYKMEIGHSAAQVKTTHEHLFLVDRDLYRPASWIEHGESVRYWNSTDWKDLIMRRSWVEDMHTRVYNLWIDDCHTYFIVVDGDKKIAVHNSKPVILL